MKPVCISRGMIACGVAAICAAGVVALRAADVVSVSSPRSGCRLDVDAKRGVWSFHTAQRSLISGAKLEVALARPLVLPQDTRYIRFRMYQHGGDWHAYIGYLEFRQPGRAEPLYRDSFSAKTPTTKYLRATNIRWRTDTEGGLICPQRRDQWAEIIYETAAREIRWVYQVVTGEEAIEVDASPDGSAWQRVARRSGEGGITPRFGDEHARPLMAVDTVPLGPGEASVAAVDDKLGPGRRITLSRTLPHGLRATAQLTILNDAPTVALDVRLANTNAAALPLLEIRPAAGAMVDLGGPALRCTVISSDYWFAPREIHRLDQHADATEWWASALADRMTERTLVVGIGEAANAGVTQRWTRRGDRVECNVRADLSPSGPGVPLQLASGREFALCRVLCVAADQVHEGLERYGSLLARGGDVRLLPRAYSGLFTGYSSSPGLTTVTTLNEARVRKLVALLKEKVGRYGIDFIKIEFEPCGSPNLLDRGRYRIEEHFPKGPQALCDEIRRFGFRPALQTRTFTFVRGDDPREREKTAELYRKFTREWGFEYLMLDFNETDLVHADPSRPRMQVFRDRFRAIREAVGPGVFIEGCMIPWGPIVGLADGYRPSQDYRGGNEDTLLGGFATRYYLHGRVFQLDSEFHDIARRPFVWSNRNVVTPLEGMRAWVSLLGLTGYSYLFGGAIEETSDERFAVASRALPVFGLAARPIDLAEHALPEVWSLCVSREAPQQYSVGLFNWDYQKPRIIEAHLGRCGLAPGKRWAAFDFWRQRYLGEIRGALSATLPPRNCQVVWLTGLSGRPEIIGGSRHLTGFHSGAITGWDPAARMLQGTVDPRGDSRVSLFIHLPQALPIRACEGAQWEQVETHVVRLDFAGDGTVKPWRLTLDPTSSVR